MPRSTRNPGSDPSTRTDRNIGQRIGREVVQAYLEEPDDDPKRPARVPASFATVHAAPGEQVEVRRRVPARAFAHFDDTLHRWTWPSRTYTLHIGRSSRDFTLTAEVEVQRTGTPVRG